MMEFAILCDVNEVAIPRVHASGFIGSTLTMSKPQSKAEALAATISRTTAEISQYLEAQGLPDLSFAPEAPPVLVLPPQLQKARAELLDATAELHDLATGPLSYIVALTSPTVSDPFTCRMLSLSYSQHY